MIFNLWGFPDTTLELGVKLDFKPLCPLGAHLAVMTPLLLIQRLRKRPSNSNS